MSEFKKWFSKECDDDRTIYQSSYDDCQDAWEAALEWVLSNWDGETDMMTLGLNIRDEMSVK